MDGKPPPVKKPRSLAGYLEALSRPVFQAGMSWRVIDAKWEGIRDAFAGFDPETVADFGPDQVDLLLGDARVVRSRAKIESTIDNAQAMIELAAEHNGFSKYLRSLGSFEQAVGDLKRQFRFIGDSGAYYFLYVVGEQVPPHDEWFGKRAEATRRSKRTRRSREKPHRATSGRTNTGAGRARRATPPNK
jgi:hypothetical protein